MSKIIWKYWKLCDSQTEVTSKMSIFLYKIIMGRFRCYGNVNNVGTVSRITIKIDNDITGLIPDKTKQKFVKIGPFWIFRLLTMIFDLQRLETFFSWPWPLYFCNFCHLFLNILSLARPLYSVSFRSYGQNGDFHVLRDFDLDLWP